MKNTRLVTAAVTAAAALWFLPSAGDAESATSPVPNADSATVARTTSDYHTALASGDSAKALSLLADDAVVLEAGGVETREEYRAHHLSGDIAFAKSVKESRSPVVVTVSGNVAWTSSTGVTQGTYNGRAINSVGAESMVLTKESDGWRIRQIHWSSRARRAAN